MRTNVDMCVHVSVSDRMSVGVLFVRGRVWMCVWMCECEGTYECGCVMRAGGEMWVYLCMCECKYKCGCGCVIWAYVGV